jgi:hypothetical protein
VPLPPLGRALDYREVVGYLPPNTASSYLSVSYLGGGGWYWEGGPGSSNHYNLGSVTWLATREDTPGVAGCPTNHTGH